MYFVLFTENEINQNIQENITPVIVEKATEAQKEIEKLEGTTRKSISDVTDYAKKEKETEMEVHRLVNLERQNHGLKTLGYDEKLAIIAKAHSKDMSNRGYFSHDTPEGLDPTDRANRASYSCRYTVGNLIYTGIAENLFEIDQSSITLWNSPASLAESIVSGWMDSTGHRQNILTSNYRNEGIGVIITNFQVYATQNFC